MKDEKLLAEHRKVGAYFDPKLATSTGVAAVLNEHTEREREFYKRTGRLK